MRNISSKAGGATVIDRAQRAREIDVPLVVDLDGTIVRSDVMLESLLLLAKGAPLRLIPALSWLAQGRASFKKRLAQTIEPDVATLPYDRDLIAWLEEEKRRGRKLVLATGADASVAGEIGKHLGLFDLVFASDGRINLTGDAKRARLVEEWGVHGFDYVANGRRDVAVCAAARKTILVRPVNGLRAQIEKIGKIDRVFDDHPAWMNASLNAMRPHQWLKNMLVFFPLAVDSQLYEFSLLIHAFLAFVAFSLCASSGYLFNDLMDLPNDRRHPHKKDRPLPSGRLPVANAIALMLLLPIGGFGLALLLPLPFIGALAAYFALTLTYSLRLKDVVVLDILTLAVLYCLRVAGGAFAVNISPSPWLLGFCLFLFFSLALVKRYAELVVMRAAGAEHTQLRGYLFEDRELLAALGGATGYLAALVLGLYIGIRNSQDLHLYQLLWLDCLLLLYWISYVWLMAHRGRMTDDPLVFALRDHVSRILIGIMAVVFIAATMS